MPRIMFDSTNPFAIPESAQMVLVYVDGIYRWSQAGRDRFKHAKQVTCSAVGAVSAHVGDVEVGCIWPPSSAVPWVQKARHEGYDPTIYVNELNDWGAVRQAFQRANVPEPHYWVANYNGVKEIPPGPVGRPGGLDGCAYWRPTDPWHTAGHWDESWIADHWPGVDTEPQEEQDMTGEQAEQLAILYSTLAERKDGDPRPPVQQHADFIVNTLAPLIQARPVTLTPEQLAELRSGLAAEVADLLAERLRD